MRPLALLRCLLSLLVVLAPVACASTQEAEVPRWPAGDATYRPDAPDAVFMLDKELKEISGLTYLGDGLLGAVQDEDGRLYVLDAATGKVVDSHKFEKDGDYEGVERVGRSVYVLRSDGDLYRIADWQADDLDVDKIETHLSQKYDTEGLAYDAAANRLLIACKEYAGKELDGVRAVYAYDLEAGTVSEAPVYLLDVRGFNAAVVDDNPIDDAVRGALEGVSDLSGFKPSALAVHPLTGDRYLLSSVRKALVRFRADGTVTGVWPLDEAQYPQPEGLTFLPDGTLIIASEAESGGKARLVRLAYHPAE